MEQVPAILRHLAVNSEEVTGASGRLPVMVFTTIEL